MTSEDKLTKPVSRRPTSVQLETVKKIITAFLLTRKKYSLYPEGHAARFSVLEQFKKQLDTYLDEYDELRLHIEKDRIIFRDQTVHLASLKEGTLPFTLFRDGIRWLEFIRGINTDELQEFLRIIGKYSILSDEPEGDIVTDFWETQLSHIKYEFVDMLWETESEKEFFQSPSVEAKDKASSSGIHKPANWLPQVEPSIEYAAIALTAEEELLIQEMVSHEEESDQTACLDALLDSLFEHRVKENFDAILEVLEEEFKSSLLRKDFAVSLKIVKDMQYILGSCIMETPWAVQLIEVFFLTVSSPRSLLALRDVWPEVTTDKIEILRQFFSHLQPEAIHTLGDILEDNSSLQLQTLLVDAITNLATRDIRPLEFLFSNSDELLVQKLIPVLINMEGEQNLALLITLLHHKNTSIRKESLNGYLQSGRCRIQDIFDLIDDENESIRRLILKQISISRDQITERLLLDYLASRKAKNSNAEFIVACFTALGQCGTSQSISFLRRTLLKQGWKQGCGKSAERKGAALALHLMRMDEARKVLEEASHSLNLNIRSIAKKVKQGLI